MSAPQYIVQQWDDSLLTVNVNMPLSWAEYHRGMAEINSLVLKSKNDVNVIYNFANVGNNVLPPGGAVQEFNHTLENMPDNLQMQVLVRAPKLLQTTIQLYLISIGQYADLPVYFVYTEQEALDLINQNRNRSHEAGAG